ncbi:SufD family Fe-S cluster assembly protein [Floccifex sp.]|uniref:SufD family Fe-S cluster assembly protein n=1 Tax=Floccifex sp. TaxID=2815810 RepID=UPI003F0843F3
MRKLTGNNQWVFEPFQKEYIYCSVLQDCILDIVCKENSTTEIFLLIQNCQSLQIHVTCLQDSICKIALFDLQDQSLTWNVLTELKEQGAQFEVNSAQLCQKEGKKKGNIEVCHLASHTLGLIQNFAVLGQDGFYEMKANGNIINGSIEAQSHQKTRVLTLSKGHSVNVTPLLLIGENQVKASHALSIGQPNEDQLYYLQSRGLSKSQALGLLSVGYFLPVIHMVKDEDLQENLQKEMEEKVGLYGRS